MISLKQFLLEKEAEEDIVQYRIPPEIIHALEDKLQMTPLIRYVKDIKALNSIPPAYTIFLHSGQDFDIYYEQFSLLLKIQGREYWVGDAEERSNAIEHINKLLVHVARPIRSHIPPEADVDDEDEDEGPATPTTPTPTPPPAGNDDTEMEPEEDEPEEEV